MTKSHLVVFLVCLTATGARRAENDAAMSLWGAMRPSHTRLLVLDGQLEFVQKLIATEPAAGLIHQRLQAEAEKMLAQHLWPIKSAEWNTPFWM